MRTPFVAANWKMNKTIDEARALVADLGRELDGIPDVEKVLCPPFTSLMAVYAMLEGLHIGLGAQNMYWEEKGAYTGEISPQMVAELCGYVILGHSERRTYFGETDETVNRKLKAALAHNLTPIVCIGENLAQYESGQTAQVVGQQARQSLANIDPSQAARLVIAYEPVWAIGTGRASSPDNANGVHRDVVRTALAELFGDQVAGAVRVAVARMPSGFRSSEV